MFRQDYKHDCKQQVTETADKNINIYEKKQKRIFVVP